MLLGSRRGGAYLGATVDGLSEPDVLLALGASEPVLLGDALGVGVDAGLTGGEVAEDLDGVVDAALVGVDPVESYKEPENPTNIKIMRSKYFHMYLRGSHQGRLTADSSLSLPLAHSGWPSLMSRQVRAGFFLDPSGESRLSI